MKIFRIYLQGFVLEKSFPDGRHASVALMCICAICIADWHYIIGARPMFDVWCVRDCATVSRYADAVTSHESASRSKWGTSFCLVTPPNILALVAPLIVINYFSGVLDTQYYTNIL